MNSKKLKEIQSDLAELSSFDVILFGSQVEGGARPTSDYDITIVTGEKQEESNLLSFKKILGMVAPPYEAHIFELLPIHIQISVIKNYQVIFGDHLEISEYFYPFRKAWEDCKRRIISNQITGFKEREKLQANSKRILAKYIIIQVDKARSQ